ncbi:MAG: alpha/beta hydrolase [Lachnospiraceae bacterium]
MSTLKFTLPNDRIMSYMEYGNPDGKAVIVLHGLVGSVAEENLAEQLKDIPLRLIYLARPGYGESDYFPMECVSDWGRQLEPFLDALHLESFDVVGISAGAPYAYSMAVLYAGRVRTVYINSGVTAVYDPDIISCYTQQSIEAYRQLLKITREEAGKAIYKIYLPLFTEEVKKSRNFQDSMGGNLMNIGQESILQVTPWGFSLGDIPRPVVLLHGTLDTVVPYSGAKAMASRIPGAQLITLDSEEHSSGRTMQKLLELLTR